MYARWVLKVNALGGNQDTQDSLWTIVLNKKETRR
jgi:hypothetical protein